MPHAAGDEGDPQHKKQVAHDGPDQRRLDDRELARAHEQHADDQLGQVAQRCVQEPSAARSEPNRELLGRRSDQRRERNDRQGSGGEDQHRLMGKELGAERDRDEDEQPVERRTQHAFH